MWSVWALHSSKFDCLLAVFSYSQSAKNRSWANVGLMASCVMNFNYRPSLHKGFAPFNILNAVQRHGLGFSATNRSLFRLASQRRAPFCPSLQIRCKRPWYDRTTKKRLISFTVNWISCNFYKNKLLKIIHEHMERIKESSTHTYQR